MSDTYGTETADRADNARPAGAGVPDVRRDDAPEATQAHVRRLQAQLRAARKKHAGAFRRMREDQRFASGEQWPGQSEDDILYRANIVQQHVQKKVAALYAKNPTVLYQRRPRLDFQVWDENPQTLARALARMEEAVATGQMPDPESVMLYMDVQKGTERRRMIGRIGRTLQVLVGHSFQEQEADFKSELKMLVKRVLTTGVGYYKIGFQRRGAKASLGPGRVSDDRDRIAAATRLMQAVSAPDADADSAAAGELDAIMSAMAANNETLLREGLVYEFPESTSILVDPRCRQLRGFVGARWIAEEYLVTPEDVYEVYGVTPRTFSTYTTGKSGEARVTRSATDYDPADDAEKTCCVWVRYDKATGMEYHLLDGHDDFLRPPSRPQIEIEGFWPIRALVFNDLNNPHDIFPESDVRLLRHMQLEYNRSREALRQHRIASRPKWAASKGRMSEEDRKGLATLPPHHVVELDGMEEGDKIGDLIQPLPAAPVDPNLYETGGVFADIQRVSGSAEANLGGTSGATATESAIAEDSRTSSLASNVDELDEFLAHLARDASKVALREYGIETVRKVVGPGAVWPEFAREQIADEIWLETEAGSSGRPNRAQDLANFERAAPFLMQVPGITPEWLAQYMLRILDERIDVTEAYTAGILSITAMNGATQVGTGDPASDPNAQGPAGGANAERPGATEPGAQPAFPAPAEGRQPAPGQPQTGGMA